MADTKVKAAVLVEPRKVELQEFPMPEIGPDTALLRVEMAGICGTDAHYYHGTATPAFPQILGHEILGHIATAGPEFLARHNLAEGDRVVVNSMVPCGKCAHCAQGHDRQCTSGIGYGTRTSATRPPHLWGAYSEYMYLVPNVSTHHVPQNISAEAAVVAVSSLANGIRWCRTLGGATIAKPVVIQGVGPQGLTSVIAAKESGAFPIIVTGLTSDRPRLDLARELGADICVDVQTEDLVEVVRRATDGAMAPTVVDVSGAAQAIATSVALVAPHGIIVGGGLVPQGQTVPLNTNEMARKEVRYQGAWTHGYEDSHQALLVAEQGKYPLDKIISHQYTLDEADLALRVMGREVEGVNPIKVAIRP